MNRTYEERRESVMHADGCDVFSARDVAYDWHGGQGSALYSFASTDCTVWSEAHRGLLVAEIERCIATVKASSASYYTSWDEVDQFTRESVQSGTPEADWGSPLDAGLESLANLLRVVRAMPARRTEEES